MGVISWIILGLIAGWIASKFVNKSGSGMTMDIALGVVGAIVGGIIASFLGMSGVTGRQHLEHHRLGDRRGGRALDLPRGCRAKLTASDLGGAPARRRRFVFALGVDPPSTVPSGRRARFQNGARVFRKSINISAAANASPRCADATATRTICSPGAMRPCRWITVHALQRPARLGLPGDPRHLFLRHAGIMFEFEGREQPVLVAAMADEGHSRSNVLSSASERGGLARQRRSLPAGPGWSPSSHPPVIGGKNAISFAPAMVASCRACTRSSAARTVAGFSKA